MIWDEMEYVVIESGCLFTAGRKERWGRALFVCLLWEMEGATPGNRKWSSIVPAYSVVL